MLNYKCDYYVPMNCCNLQDNVSRKDRCYLINFCSLYYLLLEKCKDSFQCTRFHLQIEDLMHVYTV